MDASSDPVAREIPSDATIKSVVKPSLKRDAGWTALDTFASAGLAFLFRLALARMLVPAEFGVFALAMVTFAVVQVINEFGMTATIIQRPAATFSMKLVETAYFSSTVISISLFLVNLLIIAPFAYWAYGSERVALVTAVVGLTFLFTPTVSVSRALLTRERNYRAITIARIASTIGSLLLAGGTVLIFRNVWALVVQTVSAQVLLMLAMRMLSTWRPKLAFSREGFSEMIGYSGLVFANDGFNAIAKNFDIIILGRLLSQSDVGLYSFAFYLTDVVRMNLSSILNRIMFTHYSSVQHDLGAIRFHVIRSMSWNELFLFPVMILIILAGPVIAPAVLGAKWAGMGPTLQLLSLAVMLATISGTISTVFKAVGKPGLELALAVTTGIVVLAPAIWIGVKLFGIAGAAGGLACKSLITVLVRQPIANRIIGNTNKATIQATLGSLLAQIPIVVVWLLLMPLMPFAPAINAAIVSGLGVATYLCTLGVIRNVGGALWPAFTK